MHVCMTRLFTFHVILVVGSVSLVSSHDQDQILFIQTEVVNSSKLNRSCNLWQLIACSVSFFFFAFLFSVSGKHQSCLANWFQIFLFLFLKTAQFQENSNRKVFETVLYLSSMKRGWGCELERSRCGGAETPRSS